MAKQRKGGVIQDYVGSWVEWEQKGTHREHLSVYDYKVEQRAKELEEIKIKKTEVKKVEEIQGKSSLVGNKATVEGAVFEDMKTLATKQIVEKNQEKKLKKDLKEAKQTIEQKDFQITAQGKEISKLKSTSTALKFSKENSKMQEELSYLRKFKEEVLKFFKIKEVKSLLESLGLWVKIQELIQEKIQHNPQKKTTQTGKIRIVTRKEDIMKMNQTNSNITKSRIFGFWRC